MNEIFALLWLSDLVRAIVFAGVLCAVLLFSTAFVFGFACIDATGEGWALFKKYFLHAKWLFVPVVIAMIIPSQDTIKALIVMRAGEYAINSPLGEKSIKALDAVLDRVIAEAKKK